jgi:cold shock CspA family protein
MLRLAAASMLPARRLPAMAPMARALCDSPLLTGTCKWFDVKKGFGFIAQDGDGDDVFVHQTAIHAEGFRSLGEGELVEFKLTQDERTGKTKATDVTGPQGAFVQGAPPPPPRDDYY